MQYKSLKDKRLLLRKGDEWQLKKEFKHNGGKRRRWRKVTEVGKHVGDFAKSDFRRPI
jgi:hypothetical protein